MTGESERETGGPQGGAIHYNDGGSPEGRFSGYAHPPDQVPAERLGDLRGIERSEDAASDHAAIFVDLNV